MVKAHKKENQKEITKKCTVCLTVATITCNNCNSVHYCSKEHQKEHLKAHKNDCKLYVIRTNSILGRYIVTGRDIKQGETILKDTPIVIGPPIEASPLCLNCYKPISPSKKPFCCPKCQIAPLCSSMCSATGHNKIECEKFRTSTALTAETLLQHCQIIAPLRCLFLRESDPDTWKELMKMESHLEKRRDTPIWRNHKSNVEEVLASFGLVSKDDVKNEVVQKICGILDVNTFELRIPEFELGPSVNIRECVRGVYLQAALMAHDCIGNTHLAVDDNFNLTVHASVPIKKGTPIYFNYTNALQGTYDRQDHLKEGKYFKCSCKRCRSSTDCGTHLSSLVCIKCHRGMVAPLKLTENIHRYESVWKCLDKKCSYIYRGNMIGTAITQSKNIIEDADKTDIRTVESLIKKLLITFSPNHYIILDLKQWLIGLHSEILRRDPNPSRKIISSKLQLCKEILPVLETVEPGISRLRGITYYEMHIPMVVLANREYDSGEISAEELLKRMLESEDVLKKAISCLLYEPSASPEGRLAARALHELKLLRKSVSSVEQIVENKKEAIDKRRRKKK
ncbi:SET and MYND domain containing arthropod-specific member 4 [Carabus blaptoides fortunei]